MTNKLRLKMTLRGTPSARNEQQKCVHFQEERRNIYSSPLIVFSLGYLGWPIDLQVKVSAAIVFSFLIHRTNEVGELPPFKLS